MSSSEQEERFDSLLGALAQQHTGGIDQLLETFFSFLRRRTDFFTGASEETIRSTVLRKIQQQKSIADETLRQRQAPTRRDEPASTPVPAAPKPTSSPVPTPVKPTSSPVPTPAPSPSPAAVPAASAAPSASPTATPVSDDNDDDDEKDEAEKSSGASPTAGNGGVGPGYRWIQTLSEIEVEVALAEPTRGRDIEVTVTKDHINVVHKNGTVLLAGALCKPVAWDNVEWSVIDQAILSITLPKSNRMEWWNCVVQGHPTIDTQKVTPENSKLSDLDGQTRATVEKMMVDQHRKAAGLPSEEEVKKQDILKKFMAAHPEMDFSQAKIM